MDNVKNSQMYDTLCQPWHYSEWGWGYYGMSACLPAYQKRNIRHLCEEINCDVLQRQRWWQIKFIEIWACDGDKYIISLYTGLLERKKIPGGKWLCWKKQQKLTWCMLFSPPPLKKKQTQHTSTFRLHTKPLIHPLSHSFWTYCYLTNKQCTEFTWH